MTFGLSSPTIPPLVEVDIPPEFFFVGRVQFYTKWIHVCPYSHIYFRIPRTGKGFVSERHVNL